MLSMLQKRKGTGKIQNVLSNLGNEKFLIFLSNLKNEGSFFQILTRMSVVNHHMTNSRFINDGYIFFNANACLSNAIRMFFLNMHYDIVTCMG